MAEPIVQPETTGTGGGGSTVSGTYGTNWHDLIFGTAGADQLFGLDGNDKLHGGAGGDIIDGGSGWDTATYWQATSGVSIYLSQMSRNTGDAAGDVFHGIEVIDGSTFADILEGDSLVNTFWGDAGDDFLAGWGGNDRLSGGTGNDKLVGGDGADILNGGEGFDTVSYWYAYSAVQVYLDGSKSNTGEAYGDTIVDVEVIDGSRFNDILVGDGNANAFWGDAGNDRLAGRAGADTLSGGDGYDTFVFDTAVGGSNVDTITDLNVSAGETILLSRSVFLNIREHELGISDSNFIKGAAATSTSHRLIYNASTGDLFYDKDGVGGAAQVKFAVLDKNLALSAQNFAMAWL